MPPRTRTVRAPKASKENVENLVKTKAKNTGKVTKPVRKPLTDKTNSASDENASPGPIKKIIKKSNKPIQNEAPVANYEVRPRRNRRLPPRYVENQVLNNLSNNKDNATSPNKTLDKTPVKSAENAKSPFKTPVLDNSLVASRPKRVSRLPSKFDENSSPNQFVPTHCHTSTPLVSKAPEKPKNVRKVLVGKQKLDTQEKAKNEAKITTKVTPQRVSPRKGTQKAAPQNISTEKATQPVTPQKVSPRKGTQKAAPQNISTDKAIQSVTPQKVTHKKTQKNSQIKTPNKIVSPKSDVHKKLIQTKVSEIVQNISVFCTDKKQSRLRRLRKPVEYKEDTLSPKVKSPEKKSNPKNRKILLANSSFRVLEDKKSKNGDIYEFTFDPTEEPTTQKKKKKKVTAKKPAKPKAKVYKNNYEKNIARALADLKNVVTKQKPENEAAIKTSNTVQSSNNVVQQTSNKMAISAPNPSSVVISTVAEIHTDPAQNTSVRSNISTKHVSYRVEDIAADFDASIDHEINYSPVNSPHRIEPELEHCPTNTNPEYTRPDDPLNLRNDLSFFDDQPVANSSMNASKNKTATPWRAEFENLPIKWQANTYVKPDMTPALECSFVNHFDDSKKKHVYTNMVAETNDVLPEIEDEAPKLKQTSIIAFIKEVAEKKANRKKRGASATPTKANPLFDMSNVTSKSIATPSKETSGSSVNSAENEGVSNPLKRKNNDDNNPTPAKLPRKDKENTLFGFDDSENQDQENISPVKVNRLRSLRSRSGAVLKEINKQTGPMRAELPAAMKAKLAPSSEVVEKIYDQMKSAADAPVLLDKQGGAEITNVEMADGLEDDQSVHLFEDIELVHHLKPTRKSYGKAKKVTFQNSSDSASEDAARNQSSDDDDDNLDDLSFHLPQFKPKKVTRKKKTKKQLLEKKEKEEVDAWAAGFNSMCEDIEEFDLVVE